MKNTPGKIVHMISNVAYSIVSIILFLIAFLIIIWSIKQMVVDLTQAIPLQGITILYKMMDEVALIIFSIAVADVAKYLLIKEVVQKDVKESNYKALSNLILIIATALALEGLVVAIQVAKTNLDKLLYPILLIFGSGFIIVCLAVYHKLSKPSHSSLQ